MRLIDDNVGRLEHRIAEESIRGKVLGVELLLLIFVGGIAFQPGQRRDHPKEEIELGMFFDFRLDKERAVFRVRDGAQPVENHIQLL